MEGWMFIFLYNDEFRENLLNPIEIQVQDYKAREKKEILSLSFIYIINYYNNFFVCVCSV